MFTNALRLGRHVFVSSGDFGPVPLTALTVEAGEVAWRDRSFARLSMVQLGRKVLVLDEKGALGLVSLSETGLEVHSRPPSVPTSLTRPRGGLTQMLSEHESR